MLFDNILKACDQLEIKGLKEENELFKNEIADLQKRTEGLLQEWKYLVEENHRLAERIHTLFDAIKHDDAKHMAWLEKAIKDHFAGLPVEREKKD